MWYCHRDIQLTSGVQNRETDLHVYKTGSRKKQESSRKTSISALLTYARAFDCVNHKKLWKILKEMGITDHLTYLLRNLYAGQEVTVRTGHETTIHGVAKSQTQLSD